MPNVRIMEPGPESSDEEIPEDFSFPQNGHEEPKDFAYLFKAQPLADFLKKSKSATAREYEAKTAALLKAGLVGAINAGNLPDAATLIEHGPSVSVAAGVLADADDRAKAVVDFFTTPANPYMLFAVTVLPLVSQFVRNHEREFAAAPEVFRNRKERRAAKRQEQANAPRVVIHLPFGKQIRLGIRARFPVGKIFSAFRTQTTTPDDLVVKVFSDPKVVDNLRKMGVQFRPPGDG